jgi:hypothetical protein
LDYHETDQAAPFDLNEPCGVTPMLSLEFGPDGWYQHPFGRKICKTDRKWFRAHPRRQHYVRPMLAGEFPEARPGEHWYTAVRQVRPGFRQRWGFQWFGERPPQDLFEDEAVSKIIFDLLAADPGRFMSGEELKARVLSQLMASIPPEGSA